METTIFTTALVYLVAFNEVAASETTGNQPTHKFVKDSFNEMFGKKDALEYRCQLQCHCEKCSKESLAFKTKCSQLLPKRKIPNCKCDPTITECPDPSELDESCILYCFCKSCINDPRMIPQVRQHCQSYSEWIQSCECKEQVDCEILGVLQKYAEKKGKLKSTQYEKEL